VSKRTLLLADDSVTIQKVVNLTFADEGIDVVTVGDGNSAMQKISERTPDVVLADVHMPGLTGYQICEMVRQNPETQNLPVVLLVGSFEPFDEGEAARVGANAYLTKPFQSIRQLVSQVTDLMQVAGGFGEPQVVETQPEPEAEEPERKTPDTTDIDSLYEQSFSARDVSAPAAEAPAPQVIEDSTSAIEETGPPRYVDVGMDDDMIETSFVGEAEPSDDTGWAPVGAEQSNDWAAPDTQENIGWTTSESQPEISQYAPAAEQSESADWNIPEAESEMPEYAPAIETSEPVPVQVQEFAAAAPQPFDSYAEEDRTVSFEEHGQPAETASTEEDTTDDLDRFAKTEQIPTLDIGQMETEFALDEMELLDLPPIENGKTIEMKPGESEGQKGGVNLTAEQMEMIVQKVVDKLSKKY